MFQVPFFLIKTALTVLVVIGITQIQMQSATLSNLFKISCYKYAIWSKVSYSIEENVLFIGSFD